MSEEEQTTGETVTPDPFETLVPIEVQLDEAGRWWKVDISLHDHLKCLQTGQLLGKRIAAVKMWFLDSGQCLIWDFNLPRSGMKDGWRLEE